MEQHRNITIFSFNWSCNMWTETHDSSIYLACFFWSVWLLLYILSVGSFIFGVVDIWVGKHLKMIVSYLLRLWKSSLSFREQLKMLGKLSLKSKLRNPNGLLKVVESFSYERGIVLSELEGPKTKTLLKVRASPRWKAVFSISRCAHLRAEQPPRLDAL